MTRGVWHKTITDDEGNIEQGASVVVIDESTGIAPANGIHDSRTGGAALANPFLSDAEGFAEFYADPGRYRVTVTSSEGTKTYNNEQLVIYTPPLNQAYSTTRIVDTYTVTPEINPTTFPILQAGVIIEFDLDPVYHVGPAIISFNGNNSEIRLIDGSATGYKGIDGNYTKRIRCVYNGVYWLVVSDLSSSNNDVTWSKFANGTMIMRGSGSEFVTITTSDGYGGFYGDGNQIIYPKNFIDEPSVTFSGDTNCWNINNVSLQPLAAAFPRYHLQASTVSASYSYSFIAVGRWY